MSHRTRIAALERGSVASFDFGDGLAARGIVPTSQAATSNSAAMNSAWALMSLPLMFRIAVDTVLAGQVLNCLL